MLRDTRVVTDTQAGRRPEPPPHSRTMCSSATSTRRRIA
jgi:hypothetical protein